MDKTALLKKVRALAEHGVGGEAENAEKLLARMMKKYGISEEELDEETRVRCKWLDRYKKDGNGYCCMVERSKTQREKVRRPDMERCELYKPGDFNTRYRTEVNE